MLPGSGSASHALTLAQAATIATTEALLAGDITLVEWRRADWSEVCAAASIAAIERGFGHFTIS